MYVLLDGFDLGVGILYPFAPSEQCRNRMMNSVAPFWDGNETWLVLGGGGLFAAFPLAYSILMPAFYMPIIMMLLGLILRGVAFEFRFKAIGPDRFIWDTCFHFGSLTATFCQGIMLGAFVQGLDVVGRNYAGGPFDWATSFSMMTGMALVFGYGLLGATWLIMKTDGITQQWARRAALYLTLFVAFFMALVSISVPLLNEYIKNFCFSFPNFFLLIPIPLATFIFFIQMIKDLLQEKAEYRPFILTISIFFMGYLGLGLSLYPWIVPYQVKIAQAAASGPGIS